ncbi:MAG TPA: carboxymuconolactone decarboxylase family protein [Glycomyces sp.]
MNATAPRFPNPGSLVPAVNDATKVLYQAAGNGSIPRVTISLVQLRVGQIFQSEYLTTLQANILRGIGETEERIGAVVDWKDASVFDEAERAALALAEAVFTESPTGQRVTDEVYAAAAEHYDEEGLVTLATVIGQVGFFVPLAVIGQPIPGVSPSKQWRQ